MQVIFILHIPCLNFSHGVISQMTCLGIAMNEWGLALQARPIKFKMAACGKFKLELSG